MELVDTDWLKGAVKPKRFIDFIPEQCILCEGCVDICPWYCIFMVNPDAVDDSGNVELARQMEAERHPVLDRRQRVHALQPLRRALPHRRAGAE